MKKYPLNYFYAVDSCEYHNEIKDKLLHLIDESNKKFVDLDDLKSTIDWGDATTKERKWLDYYTNYISKHLNNLLVEFHASSWKIEQIWFQQYDNDGMHDWHTHGSTYTGVYYLELDDESPMTEIIETTKDLEFGDVKTLNAKEGDLVIFPSWLPHRAPTNRSNKRKTIISFNMEFMIDIPFCHNHVKNKLINIAA